MGEPFVSLFYALLGGGAGKGLEGRGLVSACQYREE